MAIFYYNIVFHGDDQWFIAVFFLIVSDDFSNLMGIFILDMH